MIRENVIPLRPGGQALDEDSREAPAEPEWILDSGGALRRVS